MIVAYTYDADQYCPLCTAERFPAESDDDADENGVSMTAEDSEGNPLHPVFSWDECDNPDYCRACVDVEIANRGR